MPIFDPRPPRAGAGLPQQIYLPRAAGLGLGGIGIAMALFERGGPAWAWALVVFGALIWPHIAYQRSSRSRMPDRAERRNLLQGFGAGVLAAAAIAALLPWTFMPDSSLRVQLMRAAREVPTAALLLCDVDHFKQINDAGGHAAGDRVIREMGEVLRRRVRPGDLAARYGGDEFVVLLQDVAATQAVAFAEQLQVDLRLRMATIGADPAISISTGIACYDPAMESPGAWMASADAALYMVKRRQRGGTEVALPMAGAA